MCQTIVINRGEKEITTPAQFKEHFGMQPYFDYGYNMNACLCQIDIERSLKSVDAEFKTDDEYDYYVGQLDKLIF